MAIGDEDRFSNERVSGGSAGVYMSTPKHSETGKQPLFDPGPISRISNTPSQKSLVAKHGGGGDSTKAVLSLVNRNRASLYFGFVAIGDSQVLEQRLRNVSEEQLRVRCSLESVYGQDVFSIVGVSSMTIEPGAELAINVRYQPRAVEMNADTKLVVERTNGDPQRYSFKLLGYGGRGDLRLQEEYFTRGVAHQAPSGIVVLFPDFFAPLSDCPIRFFFNVVNKGTRPCFASVRALRSNSGNELPRDYVSVQPSRFILSAGESGVQQIMVRINEQLSGKPTPMSAKCFGPPSTMPSDDTEFRLTIIWGEEHQRQRLKTWETALSRKVVAYGQSFSEVFVGESCSPASHSLTDRPFEYEDEEFVNALRMVRVNVVDNRAITREKRKSMAPFTTTTTRTNTHFC